MNTINIFSIILIILAILPLLMVLIKMSKLRSFKKKAVTATASITQVEKRAGARGSVYYVLTLEYRSKETTALFIKHSITTKKYEPGQTIPLMYLPDNPDKFSIESVKRYFYMLAITFVFFMLILRFCVWLSKLSYT